MGSDYPIAKIGDLANSVSDTHKSGKEQLIFLNTSDVLHGKVLHHTYSTVKNWPGQAKKSIRKDDILFSEIRPANGRWAYIDIEANDYVVSTKLMVIRARQDRVLPKFLYLFLTSPVITNWLQHIAESRSGTFPQITFDQVASLELPLPPIQEQKAIAHVLGTLDDKIELNREMNRTLEAMAQALFKSWFVDFDPVRAKMEGRAPSGMDAATAALFPDSFEDSVLGLIPKGWKISALAAVAQVIMGLSPKGDTYNNREMGTPLVNGPVEFGSYFPLKSKWTTAPARLSQKGDLILCVRGSTTGRRVVADDVYCLGRGVCAIRGSEGLQAFVNEIINSNLERLLAKTTGSVFPNLSAPDIKGFHIILPTLPVIQKFCELIHTLNERLLLNLYETETLVATRDFLLPKLLSGEIHVSRASLEVSHHAR